MRQGQSRARGDQPVGVLSVQQHTLHGPLPDPWEPGADAGVAVHQ